MYSACIPGFNVFVFLILIKQNGLGEEKNRKTVRLVWLGRAYLRYISKYLNEHSCNFTQILTWKVMEHICSHSFVPFNGKLNYWRGKSKQTKRKWYKPPLRTEIKTLWCLGTVTLPVTFSALITTVNDTPNSVYILGKSEVKHHCVALEVKWIAYAFPEIYFIVEVEKWPL